MPIYVNNKSLGGGSSSIGGLIPNYDDPVDITSTLKAVTTTKPYTVPYNCYIIFGLSENRGWKFTTAQGTKAVTYKVNVSLDGQDYIYLTDGRFFEKGTNLYLPTGDDNDGNFATIYSLKAIKEK